MLSKISKSQIFKLVYKLFFLKPFEIATKLYILQESWCYLQIICKGFYFLSWFDGQKVISVCFCCLWFCSLCSGQQNWNLFETGYSLFHICKAKYQLDCLYGRWHGLKVNIALLLITEVIWQGSREEFSACAYRLSLESNYCIIVFWKRIWNS